MKKLNLGCGSDYRSPMDGWINVDLGATNDSGKKIKLDVSHNLNKFPYPFEDNTFEEVIATQVLEHLYEPPKVMEEIIRICEEGAIITITVPHFSDVGAYEEPNHKHYFALNSIDYMKYSCVVIEKKLCLHHNPILNIIGRVFTISPFLYEHFLHGLFPIKMIKWVLRVKK